jgi:hypothetical protein
VELHLSRLPEQNKMLARGSSNASDENEKKEKAEAEF